MSIFLKNYRCLVSILSSMSKSLKQSSHEPRNLATALYPNHKWLRGKNIKNLWQTGFCKTNVMFFHNMMPIGRCKWSTVFWFLFSMNPELSLMHVCWCPSLGLFSWHKTPTKTKLGVNWVHLKYQSVSVVVSGLGALSMGVFHCGTIINAVVWLVWIFCPPLSSKQIEGNNKLDHILPNLKLKHSQHMPEDQVFKTHVHTL